MLAYNLSCALCISVKLKNLKANHNPRSRIQVSLCVVYIRKVKKSESKSQLATAGAIGSTVVYIRKVKKSESKSQHQGTCSTKIIFERNRGRLSTQLIRLS